MNSLSECQASEETLHFEILHIYPNPTTQTLEVEYQTHEAKETTVVDIIDMTGKSIKTQVWKSHDGMNKNQILVEELPTASYIVRLRQGSYTTTRQFVKN